MSDIFSFIYGPLDKGACMYFLILTIMFYILLVVTFFTEIFMLIKNRKNITFRNIANGILLIFNIFIAYFVNRLLLTMCKKSLD
jgi:hypothetical protein